MYGPRLEKLLAARESVLSLFYFHRGFWYCDTAPGPAYPLAMGSLVHSD